MFKYPNRFRSSGKGQSLVEVALLMPVLILIVAGTLDLGRAYFTLVALKDAAAEGATYAALHPDRTAQIAERAAASNSALVGLEPSMVSVSYQSPPTPGLPITVTVTYPYQFLTPLAGTLVPSGTLQLTVADVRAIIGE